MSLFQKSEVNKYLNELDSVLVDRKYKEFQNYYGKSFDPGKYQKFKGGAVSGGIFSGVFCFVYLLI